MSTRAPLRRAVALAAFAVSGAVAAVARNPLAAVVDAFFE